MTLRRLARGVRRRGLWLDVQQSGDVLRMLRSYRRLVAMTTPSARPIGRDAELIEKFERRVEEMDRC